MGQNKKNIKTLIPLFLGVGITLIIISQIYVFNKQNLNINSFIVDAKNISNYASSYFNKNIDPSINETIKIEKEVDVKEVIPDNIKSYNDYQGTIKIAIVNNKVYYYLNIKNNNYKYSGNLDDLIVENIKKI